MCDNNNNNNNNNQNSIRTLFSSFCCNFFQANNELLAWKT